MTAASSDHEGGGRYRGEYLEMEWWLPPSAETPPKHIHPHQREDYEVLDGAFEVFVRDGWPTVVAGASASAPVGEVHTFRVGDRGVRVRNVHPPPLDFEDYFAAESALARPTPPRTLAADEQQVCARTRPLSLVKAGLCGERDQLGTA